MDVSKPHSSIACEHERWNINADVIAGHYAVKKRGPKYLPKAYSEQEAKDYKAFKDHVSFYPAANRTLTGLLGLMFRRAPVLENSGIIENQLKDIITRDGKTVNELAKAICKEYLTTAYYGLLVDHPSGSATSAGEAIAEGIRPYVLQYPAHSILEVRRGVVGRRRGLTYVRILDDEETVRVLELVNGIYTVVIHKKVANTWVPQPAIVPRRNGQPLREIPFVLISEDDMIAPQPSIMDHVVQLNLDHYRVQGLLTSCHMFISTPMLFAKGLEKGAEDKLTVSPGAIISAESTDADLKWVAPSGDGIPSLERQLERTEDKLAVVASRILARQKAVAEAAETEALRQGAENSVLASMANHISAKITQALQLVADWTDGSTVLYQLNTDYLPAKMDASEISALFTVYQGGGMSFESFFYALRDRGVHNETLTLDEEQKRLEASEPKPAAQPTAPDADLQVKGIP
ncbi:DUF4055 domain-containing protein [Sphingobium sp. PAMC28499]|uniref:DUF4055 domain-containing protein n=1 Tax=Sphingobium sp. PAMC28499 TaxID=2565554 RepID=UPI00109E0B86|nr:DUF4055 domain-containing protein [Sphingobium sp. PAMC28499]QCB39195.1 DUF4055 domain-containing protein [Sphingobium sp. PAMC28499]|tara:strand:+ start:16416 stop:17801 length:1386 start_codon:yes stop_codon:yes gene_type:complete